MASSAVQPNVLGAVDTDFDSFALSGKPWHHKFAAEDLISALFLDLESTAAAAQKRADTRQLHESSAKRNRHETYLDSRKRTKWEARSLCFLSRIPEIAGSLSTEALYSTLTMQHLLDIDADDQRRPADQRHSEDTVTDGVSDQFLIDAPRGRFTVDGELFYFPDTDPHESKEAFVRRLVQTVRQVSPPSLLVNVTSAMSQSGLAALERACLCCVAVSGGTQEVDYALERSPERVNGVLVKLQVLRRGFRSYIIDSNSCDADPLSCDSQSSVQKSAVVAFGVDGNVDVTDLREEVHILQGGCMVPAETLCRPAPRISRPGKSKSRFPASPPECRLGPGSGGNVECRVQCCLL